MIEARGRQTWMAWTGLALLIGAVYLSGLRHPFHYDDIHSIVDNLHIRTLGNIPAFFVDPTLFAEDPQNAMFRPLILVSYAINYALSEYQTWSYHGVNILLHLLNSGLVFLIIRHIVGRALPALMGALIFALHLLNSEVVNYISSRSETMCALFFASSFFARRRGQRL